MSKDNYAECEAFQCAIVLPIGYTSPRGYCAKCEWTIGKKFQRESMRSSGMIKQIASLVEHYDHGGE